MPESEVHHVAGVLRVSIGMLVRSLRQMQQAEGDVTLPETSALRRLDQDGPTSAAALAKLEQISPQSMGATLGALESRGLVERRPDPLDGRRAVISLTEAGRQTLWNTRNARTEAMARALSEFTAAEREHLLTAAPLIERLARAL